MGCGAAEATGLGFVCFVVSTVVCCQPTELILRFFVPQLLQSPQVVCLEFQYLSANILHKFASFIHSPQHSIEANQTLPLNSYLVPRGYSTAFDAYVRRRYSELWGTGCQENGQFSKG